MEGLDSVYEEAHKLYEDGKRKEAFDRYLALAEEGFVDCQTFVGWMLFSGEGVKSDLIEARSWLERSSEKGDVEALYYLGKINIIEEKFESALACFKESMAHSYLPAVYALGMMYKLGQGVERSPEKAYECFDKAGNKGHIFSQKGSAAHTQGRRQQ